MVTVRCHLWEMSTTRRISLFLLLAFGFTWTLAAVAALLGVTTAHPAYVAVAAGSMLGPALAAVLLWKVLEKAPWRALGLHPRLIRWRGMLATVAVGVLIVPLALLASHVLQGAFGEAAFGDVELSGERFAGTIRSMLETRGVSEAPAALDQFAAYPGAVILTVMMLAAIAGAFTVNLPFMLGEELGWRGYLYAATAAWSPARRVLFTGVVWGLWHAPLILMGHNYPGFPVAGIGMMVLFCTALSLLFDHARLRGNSVWAASVLHGILNGAAGSFALFTAGGHVLLASPAGVAGIVAILVLGGLVLAGDAGYRRTFFRAGMVLEAGPSAAPQ
jgi:uncharacterized protein